MDSDIIIVTACILFIGVGIVAFWVGLKNLLSGIPTQFSKVWMVFAMIYGALTVLAAVSQLIRTIW